MPTITFPDGRWVRLRVMYVDDTLAVADLGTAGEELDQATDELRAYQPTLEAAAGTPGAEAVVAVAMEKLEAVQNAYHAQLRRTRDVMQDAVEETSWGGPLGKGVTSDELGLLVRQWRTATDDDAIPPESGTGS